MKKFIALIAIGLITVAASAQQPPRPDPARVTWGDLLARHQAEATPQAPTVQDAKAKPHPRAKRPRGAIPTPRRKIFAAKKYTPRVKAPAAYIPPGLATAQLSYWGNDTYGDCVTAEEMAAKVVYSLTAGLPEVFIPSAAATQWAGQHGYLNGANLTDVMDTMAQTGIVSGGATYKDGPYASVDYTTYATVCAAISEGPVKIGVAADQLDGVVGTTNGWIATGYSPDSNEDHCIGLVGCGTMTQCFAALNVAPPADAANYAQCYVVFTWDTFGVMDHASMVNITGEAWERSPTTVGEAPAPTPTPTPTPTPAPTGLTYSLTGTPPAGSSISPTGVFAWPQPATPGITTVTFAVSNGTSTATGSFAITVSAAASTIAIGTIPAQSATVGAPFSLDLSTFVTTTTGGHK